MKTITICSSLKFEDDINYHSARLTLEGNCVFPLILFSPSTPYTPEQKELFARAHRRKIDLSDAIFVINKNGYIGNSVREEIEYARAKGKEILYLENPAN